MYIPRFLIRIFFTSILLLFQTQFASAIDLEAEKSAIIKADGDWFAVSKDAEKFIGYTDPDFTFYPPGAPFMSDKKLMIKHWKSIVTTPGLKLVWGPNGANVSKSGDLGYSHGWYKLTTVDDKGKPTISKGKYVTVMRKQSNGEWRPLIDIFNAD